MTTFARLRERPWLALSIVALATVFSVGCSSSKSNSGATSNPLGAYEINGGSSGIPESVIDGSTQTPGKPSSPIISVPGDGNTPIEGHDNAPLLDNSHAGWQQSSCLTCHNGSTNNPDHNYTDDTLCYLCHGTNGLPGFNDTTPPVLSGVAVNPTDSSVTISWKSDEGCLSRLVLKTIEGDRMEFPVSTTYTTSHKYTVNGLQSGTTYYYELVCTDKSGNKTSSSSFSSAMTFKTNVKVNVPNSGSGNTSSDSEPSDDTLSSIFMNLKVEPYTGSLSGQIKVSFSTAYKPDTINWFIYDQPKDGNRVKSDDASPSANNSYDWTLDTYLQAGTYYFQVAMTKPGTTKTDTSKRVKFTLK